MVISGTLTASGTTPWLQVTGFYNIQLSGTWAGSAVLERSFDNGVTAVALAKDVSGTPNAFTANTSLSVFEPESGDTYAGKPQVLVRFNWTRTSGTLEYRIGQ
jgi:hypothetical protein